MVNTLDLRHYFMRIGTLKRSISHGQATTIAVHPPAMDGPPLKRQRLDAPTGLLAPSDENVDADEQEDILAQFAAEAEQTGPIDPVELIWSPFGSGKTSYFQVMGRTPS